MVLENPHKLPWSTFLGVLGMPGKSSKYKLMVLQVDRHFFLSGQTAYVGWKEYSDAKKVNIYQVIII